ncbi:MAG TPA: HEAT repeat domain-containing protein [Longimicrobium sp.]|jgi:HEAT repeat protein
MTDSLLQTNANASSAANTVADPLRAEVREVVQGISKALRAHLLYEGKSPALDRFMELLAARLGQLWEQVPHLTLSVEERELHWQGAAVFQSDERDNLAFLLYRDGVREVTLRRGFEEEELQRLVEILAHAHQVRGADEDDLLTIFWEKDWLYFRYRYVEALPDGVHLPDAVSGETRAVAAPRAEAEQTPRATLTTDDFREALYFLDQTELNRLAAEVRAEMERDLWTGVLTALFDRMQDGTHARQEQVMEVLGDAIPTLLGAARVDLAAYVVGEMVSVATTARLAPGVLRGVRALFAQLAEPATVAELVRTVEEAGERVRDDDLSTLLSFFPPEALGPLVRAAESSGSPRVRATVQSAAERLGDANREHLVRLLAEADATLVTGAARLVGRLRVQTAAGEVTRLLSRPEAPVRLAAVEALQEIRSPSSAGALEGALEDADREVRVAAARALGTLRYAPARAKLEAALDSKRLRDSELSERIAFFEAYGGVAGAEGVPVLDRVLNGKSWLGRRESGETRACAALGLGRIRHPAAEKALNAAAADADPVVRSAVGRALRGMRQ